MLNNRLDYYLVLIATMTVSERKETGKSREDWKVLAVILRMKNYDFQWIPVAVEKPQPQTTIKPHAYLWQHILRQHRHFTPKLHWRKFLTIKQNARIRKCWVTLTHTTTFNLFLDKYSLSFRYLKVVTCSTWCWFTLRTKGAVFCECDSYWILQWLHSSFPLAFAKKIFVWPRLVVSVAMYCEATVLYFTSCSGFL